jgi:hypothetical protein
MISIERILGWFRRRRAVDPQAPDVVQIDCALADEALVLADGADIHKITGMVANYRSLGQQSADDGLHAVAAEFERELRAFVVRKRAERVRG